MTKTITDISSDFKESLQPKKSVVCHYVFTPSGIVRLENPILSCEKSCEWCGGSNYYCPCVDPAISKEKVWLCSNCDCLVNKTKNDGGWYVHTAPSKIMQPWPVFCEINGIGDLHHDVKFENIKQEPGKISFMLKFVESPKGILYMQGKAGTGKTYAAMGMCELFIRKSVSCIFTTQKQLSTNWLNSIGDHTNNFISTITNTSLLVVDDFGTGEATNKFLEFFMDLINSRMQWRGRGTVITTNLEATKFASFCGEALSDRINTGQLFEFKGKSRRTRTIL